MTDSETTGTHAAEATSVLAPAPADPVPTPGGAGGAGSSGRRSRRLRRPIPRRTAEHKGFARTAIEWVVLILLALVIAFLIKTFLFQAFFIPSESMTPTLKVGDRVLVNKLSYDLHDVNRGDILVFEAPASARSDGIKDLVKRAVALPGETITDDGDGHLLIDGRRLGEPYLPAGTVSTFSDVPPGCGTPADGSPGCVVPKGHAFMMGDNRGASKDSRVFGPIDVDTIVGRVFVRIWPISGIGLL
ncbi:MAG TPA: signal peptidase I [Acidimicrobiia bacterium]|nr:signal peptidase I [Acidimicrobiia bacterium]